MCSESHPTCAYGPQYVRIDPTIAQLIVHSSTGNSVYHGMTASLTRRFSNNFQFQTNYTFSKTIDDVFDYAGPVRRHFRRDVTSIADCHRLTFATTLLPAACTSAVQECAVARLDAESDCQSAFWRPVQLVFGASVNGDANTTDRPFFASRNSGRGSELL